MMIDKKQWSGTATIEFYIPPKDIKQEKSTDDTIK